MSKYPVEISDMDGVVAGVNYLLSGPSGLGQNFSGTSFSGTSELTGNPRGPFTVPTNTYGLYVPPISLSTCQMLDSRTFKYTFSATQSSAPFMNGCPIIVSGVTNSLYNQTFYPIGVVECTTTYVIARASQPITVQANSSGGTVGFTVVTPSTETNWISTDCQAVVTVTGATDRVFLSAQTSQTLRVTTTVATDVFSWDVVINRYLITNTGSISQPIYEISLDKTILYETWNDTISGPGPVIIPVTYFSINSFIDQPPIGNYAYSMDIRYYSDNNSELNEVLLGLRTLTAQVVKQ
jgi:hypothetical protein